LRKLSSCLALTLFSAVFIIACEPSTPGNKTEQIITGDLENYQGKWLVINYWASWCKPCIEEMPELNNFADNNREITNVFAVNYDGISGEDLIQQAKKLDIQFSMLTQDPSVQLSYPMPTVLPTTLIFDPQGKLLHTLIGPQTEEGLSRLIRL
jgi:thiol-disulfide isomerase/thioredoxin